MISGYYIHADALRADDGTLVCGDTWELVRCEDHRMNVVEIDGLSEKEARTLYWQKIAELSEAQTEGDSVSVVPAAVRQLALNL